MTILNEKVRGIKMKCLNFEVSFLKREIEKLVNLYEDYKLGGRTSHYKFRTAFLKTYSKLCKLEAKLSKMIHNVSAMNTFKSSRSSVAYLKNLKLHLRDIKLYKCFLEKSLLYKMF